MALELEYLNTTSRLAVGAAGEMPDGGEGGAGAGAGAAAAAAAMKCGTLGSQSTRYSAMY